MTAVFSPLDSERFGVRVLRAGGLTAATAEPVVERARADGAEVLVLRCDVADVDAGQELERLGARLMDTLLYFLRDTADASDAAPPAGGPLEVRLAGPVDAQACGDVARAAFQGYAGHYHADRRLDPAAATEAYADWAARSCTVPGVADAVLVAVADGAVVGLSTVRATGPATADGPLDAVHPSAHRRGVYGLLGAARLQWCRERGLDELEVSTHLANRGAQRGLQRLGFVYDRAEYTFHLWLGAGTR